MVKDSKFPNKLTHHTISSDNSVMSTEVAYFGPEQFQPAGSAVTPQPNGNTIPTLFQPIQIRGVKFQNRIFVSPMAQYSAKDGIVSPWHTAHRK